MSRYPNNSASMTEGVSSAQFTATNGFLLWGSDHGSTVRYEFCLFLFHLEGKGRENRNLREEPGFRYWLKFLNV